MNIDEQLDARMDRRVATQNRYLARIERAERMAHLHAEVEQARKERAAQYLENIAKLEQPE
ncbi:hypothetical protein UFOVP229_40 [uncultured Caudovirales phage]|uniref:Uncharacterized protein n=1 Tax=uncultured Caudovirales phage TaxID=2100421 RepID=A0A6J7WR08_9CAUD|nr:hypothetical protein UFOVP229_40 [uncultured Caudovirales phage]